MIDAHPRVLDPPALAGHARRARHRRARRLQLHAPADRRRAGHHQRPGADQHRGARLLAARSRAAHHLPDRDRDGAACRASSTPARCRATACRRSPSSSRTAPTSISRASSSTSASSRRKDQLPAGRRDRRWGRSPPASARSSCGRSRPKPARTKPDGTPYTPTDLRDDPGLDHQAAAAHRARRRPRSTRSAAIEQAVPRHARPGAADGLRADASTT